MDLIVTGRAIIPGSATGLLLVSTVPISFWGGIHPTTGEIIDQRHDRCGASVAGRIFAFPAEIGSSTASAVLLELLRVGKAPAAIVTVQRAPILALGAIVAEELYGQILPILQVSDASFCELRDSERVRIFEDGTLFRLDT